MYSKIHQLKEDKLSKLQVAKKLNIDYKTVTKYWNMKPQEYAKYQKKTKRRTRKLDKYKEDILVMLKTHNDYKVSQILDRLLEKYPDQYKEIKYSTLRRLVNEIRDKHEIPKENHQRQYQAISDPPYGYQAQVDLGTIILKDSFGNNRRLYCIAIVLSKSRYKFAEWFDHPPKTADFINFHEKAFRYFNGMPKEIVYDQDRLLIVSENYGDIIYTADFENFRQHKKFKTFICKSSDPESKGRIESVVKYLKYNFAQYRIFEDLNSFNQKCLDWLERTGNSNIHGTIKKVPAEVFKKEQPHLKPVPKVKLKQSPKDSITRNVRKDNTILFRSNRYTVPLGTYSKNKFVYLEIYGSHLKIVDNKTGEIIAEHKLSSKKGDLVQNNNHLRDHSLKIEELYQKTLKQLGEYENIKVFLDKIRKLKPRYVRDQYNLILKASTKLSIEEILKTIQFCIDNNLWSATEFKSVSENLAKLPELERGNEDRAADIKIELKDDSEPFTEVRSLSEYEKYMGVK